MQERSAGSISPVAAFELRVHSGAVTGLLMALARVMATGRIPATRPLDHHHRQLHQIPLTLRIDQPSPSKLTNVSKCLIKVSWNATLTARWCPFAHLNAP